MAENGLSVLLLERGGEQVYNSQQLMTSIKALTDDCAESIRSTPGHTLTTGNCMGGATSVNHGIFVQEQPEWVVNHTKMNGQATLTIDEIADAYDWVCVCSCVLCFLILMASNDLNFIHRVICQYLKHTGPFPCCTRTIQRTNW